MKMLEIPIFDNYFLDTKKVEIVSLKTDCKKVLKPIYKGNRRYYKLFLNGVSCEVLLFDLIKIVLNNKCIKEFKRKYFLE